MVSNLVHFCLRIYSVVPLAIILWSAHVHIIVIDSNFLTDHNSIRSSIPSSHCICPNDSSPYDGEVVIVVPALDPPPSTTSSSVSTEIPIYSEAPIRVITESQHIVHTHHMPSSIVHNTHERDGDPGSPRTTTESSGDSIVFLFL